MFVIFRLFFPFWADIRDTELGADLASKYPFDDSIGPCFYDLWEDVNTPYEDISTYINETYVEDIFYDELESFIKNNQHETFFAYYAPYLVHSPIQIPPKVDTLRNNASIDYSNCDLISNKGRAILCEMIQYLDYRIGLIEKLLKDLNLWDNTLIIFTSDNGGLPAINPDDIEFFTPLNAFGTNLPLRGTKITTFEGGIRSAAFMTGGYLASNLKGLTFDKLIAIEDWFATFMHLADINIDTLNNHGLQLDSIDIWSQIESFSKSISSKSESSTSRSSDSSEVSQMECVNERSEWVEVNSFGVSCLLRKDGWKIILNGKRAIDVFLPRSGDYAEFDGTNNIVYDNIEY